MCMSCVCVHISCICTHIQEEPDAVDRERDREREWRRGKKRRIGCQVTEKIRKRCHHPHQALIWELTKPNVVLIRGVDTTPPLPPPPSSTVQTNDRTIQHILVHTHTQTDTSTTLTPKCIYAHAFTYKYMHIHMHGYM